MTALIKGSDLKPGDKFHRGTIPVVVLGNHEPYTDRFGQELFRIMCEREDTGEKGYFIFGPLGVVVE